MVVIALLVLMSLATALMPLEAVVGQNQSSAVSILQVTPSSLSGFVGTSVSIGGTIATLNGAYQIIFDQTIISTGISDRYSVTAHFTVPEIPSGNYALTLRDQTSLVNATDQFQVIPAYSITSAPSQIQERGSVALNVNVTGGQPNTPYNANVAIMLPSPLNTTYTKITSLGTSNQKGTASTQIIYPDSSFQPSGSLTDYSGVYIVYFNQSDSLAQNKFSVSFLDSNTYHRGQTITVKAVGYPPNQAATLIINSVATGLALDTKSVIASADGIIAASWAIPSNVAIGDYNLQITAQGTQKSIQDTETFSVLGYPIRIKTVNLADETIPYIRVQALDAATNSVSNGTSGADGLVTLNLESGVHPLTAFWNGVNVGQTDITVKGVDNFTLQCSLIDLRFLVQNENGVPMPFVNLDVAYQYQQANGGSQTGSVSGKTDSSGIYQMNSTLTGISYSVNASIYNQIFNANNNTVTNVSAQPSSKIVIICPNELLTVNVVGNNQVAISDARLELVEVTSSLFYTATTDSSGSAISQVTFGIYRLRVYKDNILLNETNVEVFSESQKQIRCTLYGIEVSVSVVDFFGQPIQNANVTLIGPATERLSTVTQGNGTANFKNVIGGNMQIIAFAPAAPSDYQAITITINQPISIQIKLDKYIALGSFLVQVNTFITIIIIFLAVIAFVAVEIYRRKRR
jgi:hypothetical protein